MVTLVSCGRSWGNYPLIYYDIFTDVFCIVRVLYVDVIQIRNSMHIRIEVRLGGNITCVYSIWTGVHMAYAGMFKVNPT
jgi:hypothetical protein